jgi:putative endonuclease
MSRAKGDVAEARAVAFLRERDFVIVEQNFYSRFGELDIIASKEGVLHFVEVKSGEDYELAIQNITPSKLSKLIKTAQIYMKKNAYEGDFTFDAVVVTPLRLTLVEDITL